MIQFKISKKLTFIFATFVILGAAVLFHLIEFRPEGSLVAFTSDGCSLFPDSSLIDAKDWCECCVTHDIAYWKGGSEAERLAADGALRDCVLLATGDSQLAETMYIGVRLGGSPYFKNWYRWGYGWSYQRKYQALSETEQVEASEKLAAYFASEPKSPCAD